MDLYEVYSLLYTKGPRLLIAVSDSCNSFCPAGPPKVMIGREAVVRHLKSHVTK